MQHSRECGRRKPIEHGCTRPKPQGVLLNKILCCDRRLIPSLCAELRLSELSCHAKPPYQLTMVQQSGAQPWWSPLESKGNRLLIHVFIPVCCQVRDTCGELYHATAVVETDATLTPGCPPNECWRNSIMVVPCVRLCESVCSETACFHARLEISLEIYVIRPEPCMLRAPAPACPELPLYPPPIPPRWPQCPEARGRCEWPRQG